MAILKKIGAFLSVFLLGIVLFAASGAAVFHFVIASPGSIKNILEKSGIYSNLTDVFLAELSKTPKDPKEKQDMGISFSDPKVKKIVKDSFSSKDLQLNSEKFIDGTYAWLHGETERPKFTLDFTPSKKKLAKKLGDHAEKRARKLPVCTSFSQIPQEIDPLSLKCIPPGYDISSISEMVASEMMRSKDFLPDTKITAKDLGAGGKEENFFNSDNTPRSFQIFDKLLWIFLAISAVLSAGVVFLSKTIRGGLDKLGKTYIAIGALIVVSPLLLKVFLPKLSGTGPLDNQIFGEVVLPVITQFVNSATVVYLIFSGTLIALGIASLAARRKFFPKT